MRQAGNRATPECLFLLVGYEQSEEGYRDLLLRRAASLGIVDQ